MQKLCFLLIICFYNISYSYDFSALDSLVLKGIESRYFPGAQLLIGSRSEILYFKSYGSFTYSSDSKPVDDNSIFDLASLTKVAATTPAVMILYNQGKINLEDKVIKYIPEFNNNGKENITILNLLLHNSGLKDWIPFYKTRKNKEEVFKTIFDINLVYQTGSKFVYSDLNFILLGLIVERVSGKSLDEFCKEYIYSPYEMKLTMFNPSENLKNNILPTENDKYWRNKQLQGEVHDEAAYLMGGVSGNAGLFSNAKDLYKYTRTLLLTQDDAKSMVKPLKDPGIFDKSTIEYFTTKYNIAEYINTRALGWDTKPLPTSYRAPCGELISENCFGHTGYTGTSIWCDKDRNLIIIFLTNRVYPVRENNGIREFRPDLHNKIFELTENK
jgi:CubicO group peptidase (beta-lactamase class C family)